MCIRDRLLGGLVQVVVLQAVARLRHASEGGRLGRVLRGTDSRWQKASTWTWTWTWDEKHALERAKRGVGLEHVAESDEATHVAVVADVVPGETIWGKRQALSAGVGSKAGCVRAHT